jgi:hypothetical protein
LYPVLLGGDGSYNIELLYSSYYLEYIPYLTVKKGSLINALIYEGGGSCYKIKGVKVIGKKNPWWYFELGNPLLKVSIEFVQEIEELDQMRTEILTTIGNNIEYWEDSADFNTITTFVNNAESLKEIISYLSGLIYKG